MTRTIYTTIPFIGLFIVLPLITFSVDIIFPKQDETPPQWASYRYTVTDLSGEMRIELVDRDGDRDIILANSGYPDLDPSLLIMRQVGRGQWASAQPVNGRYWKPGYFQEIAVLDAIPNLVMVFKDNRFYTYDVRTNHQIDHAFVASIFARRTSQFIPYCIRQDYEKKEVRVTFAAPVLGINRESYWPSSYIREYIIDENGDIQQVATDIENLLATSGAFSIVNINDERQFIFTINTFSENDVFGYRHVLLERIENELVLHSVWDDEPAHLLAVDLNRDQRDDLVVRQGDRVTTLLQAEDGGFNALPGVSMLPQPAEYGDRFIDEMEAVISVYPRPYYSHENASEQYYHQQTTALSPTFQGGLTAGYFNDDIYPDLLSIADGLRVLSGRGDGTFDPYITIDALFPATDAKVADLDNDGDDDILAVSGNELRVYFQRGGNPTDYEPVEPVFALPERDGRVVTVAGRYYIDGATNELSTGPRFRKASRIAYNNGELYVSDSEANRVYRGNEAGNWSGIAPPDGEWNNPSGLRVRDGLLYICDTENQRIVVYDPLQDSAARIITSASPQFVAPSDLAFLADGTLLVADAGFKTVLKANADQNNFTSIFPSDFETGLIEPVAVEVHGNDRIYVTDYAGSSVKMFWQENGGWKSENAVGGKYGPLDDYGPVGESLRFPQGIAFSPSGDLYVADYANQQILKKSTDGVTWFAGSGVIGYQVDRFTKRQYHFEQPSDIVAVTDTEFLIADGNGIRQVRLGGEFSPQPTPLPEDFEPEEFTPVKEWMLY